MVTIVPMLSTQTALYYYAFVLLSKMEVNGIRDIFLKLTKGLWYAKQVSISQKYLKQVYWQVYWLSADRDLTWKAAPQMCKEFVNEGMYTKTSNIEIFFHYLIDQVYC